jgi:hypothetical protein
MEIMVVVAVVRTLQWRNKEPESVNTIFGIYMVQPAACAGYKRRSHIRLFASHLSEKD